MATLRKSCKIVNADATVPNDLVSNQISPGGGPSVGTQTCWVLADGGADEGVFVRFEVPKNYVGTPVLVIKGILDGTPAAGADLGFAFRKRAVADNEVAAGTFDAEQTFQNTDISGWADTDLFVATITLTAGDYAVDDEVYGYLSIDASGTTYTGNFLLTSIEFQYNDV